MPEGDTIHTIANAIRPLLKDETLVGGSLREAPGLELGGRKISGVEARGKHLFVHFADGETLRSHLGMHGSWHRYSPGERWKESPRDASIVLTTTENVFVCFHAEEVELRRLGPLAKRQWNERIGPDLTIAKPDFGDVMKRFAASSPRDRGSTVEELLLTQRVASGIGNVYKSEVLFLERLHPATLVETLSPGRIRAIYEHAHRLLRKNLRGGRRVTRFVPSGRGGLWVYGRQDQPCFECETQILRAVTGKDRRSTYWCPSCQRQKLAAQQKNAPDQHRG